jgi:hypothetical protein
MAIKRELIAALQDMLETKEEIIALCARHGNNALFLAGFPLLDQQEIKAGLQSLCAQSRQHRSTIENLIRTLQESEKNVY